MLNIILVANSQKRARRLVRELWENNLDLDLKVPYPTILRNNDFQISAFSKDNVIVLKGLHADQLFLEDGMIMNETEDSNILLDTLKYSRVPADYRVIKLKENY